MTTDHASVLRALHVQGDPLVLPNIWDAASARAVQEAGFPAIATGSAAVAQVLGYDDGEATPVAEMLSAVSRIAAVVDVPVTADIERGYGLKPVELVERLLATGAAGCNLEDSEPSTDVMIDADVQARFLSEVRAAAGPDLVINARIDSYMHGSGTRQEALDRARKYMEAGADCVYPITLSDPEEIRVLAAEFPINVLFKPGAPSLAELAGLGVARISFAAGLLRATQAYTKRLIQAIKEGRNPYQ